MKYLSLILVFVVCTCLADEKSDHYAAKRAANKAFAKAEKEAYKKANVKTYKSAEKMKMDFAEHNRPYISNLYQTIEMAFQQKNDEEYNAAILSYTQGLEKLIFLMKSGVISVKQGAPLQKEWQNEIMKLSPLAKRKDYIELKLMYKASLRDFASGASSSNLALMAVSLREADKIWQQAQEVYQTQEIPKDLAAITKPTLLQEFYRKALKNARYTWFESAKFTPIQIDTILNIICNTSAVTSTELISLSKINSDLSLKWLEMVYSNLVFQEPTSYYYWYGLGKCQLADNRIKDANYTWHKSLKFFPNSYYFHYQLALSCGDDKEEVTRAIVHLKWLLHRTKTPIEKAKIFNQLARRSSQSGDSKNSLKLAENSETLVQDINTAEAKAVFVEAKKTQSSILLKRKEFDRAVIALEIAARKIPANIDTKIELAGLIGKLAVSNGDVDSLNLKNAIMWYDTILRDNPKLEGIHAKKAMLYLRAEMNNQAQLEAISEMAINPNSVDALTILGYTYMNQNNTEKAEFLFNRALTLDPYYGPAINGSESLAKQKYRNRRN